MSPDVVVIGAQKSGTSTFYRNLVQVKGLNFTRQKEPNILILYDQADRIRQAYAQAFEVKSYPAIDVSPRYAQAHHYPRVAERLQEVNPHAKIIYLVRDPLERIKSHLVHNTLRDRIKTDVESELVQNRDYVLTSSYHFQISGFLRLFPKEQIKVYQLEKMTDDPLQFQQDLFGFLGVKENPMPFKPFNVSSERYVIKYHDHVHRYVTNPRLRKLYHLFWWLVSLKPGNVRLSDALLRKLALELSGDTEAFVSLFGLDRSLWKTYAANAPA